MLGLGLGLNKFQMFRSFIQLVKDAGGVLYLDARKADGSGKLTGNDSPWIDLSGVLGNQLFDGGVELGTISSVGIPTPSALRVRSINFCQINESIEYTISNDLGYTPRTYFYDENKVFISFVTTQTYTTPVNAKYYKWRTTVDGQNDLSVKVMVNIGDSALPYEDYGFNNGFLTNFAGSGTSGWQDPPPVLRFDGIDDFVGFADTASLDITTAPLALTHTFYIPTGAGDGWLKARDNVNIQYGLFFNSVTTEVEFWLENLKRASVSISLDTYHNVIFFWDGTDVTPVIDNVDQSTVGFVGTLTSQPNNYSGRRTSGGYFSHDEAAEGIYIGSDLNKIKKAEAKISAQYLALN